MRARPPLVPTVLFRPALVVAPVLALLAACSLTTSLSGLSNGPDVELDAATDQATSSADARTVVPEGGSDASEGGVDATVPFRCVDHVGALFCDDFESGAISSAWVTTSTRNGGTLVVGGGRFGLGLVASVPARPDPTPATRANATTEGSAKLAARAPVTLAFDLKIENADTGGGVIDIGGIDFHGPFYVVTFRMENDGTVHLHEYGDPIGPNPQVLTDFPLTMQPAIGTWLHVAMQLTFPTGPAHLVVLFDGATAYDGPIGASPYASQPFFYAGINNSENSATLARTVDVDDVLVTTP